MKPLKPRGRLIEVAGEDLPKAAHLSGNPSKGLQDQPVAKVHQDEVLVTRNQLQDENSSANSVNLVHLLKLHSENPVILPLSDGGYRIAIQKSPQAPDKGALLATEMGVGAQEGNKKVGMGGQTQ